MAHTDTHSQDSSRDLVVWIDRFKKPLWILAVNQCDVSGMLGEHTVFIVVI